MNINTKELKDWLVGKTIEEVDYDKKLEVLALDLDDKTTLIISTSTAAKAEIRQ
ncbi:MAG TPA: hypothetical protein PKC05_03295 [Candidatus Saccharibacteria bacterium]|nr:hypothetical protein [Candidatus Saccharibacteria bacterium]